jgi:hypothetical protein
LGFLCFFVDLLLKNLQYESRPFLLAGGRWNNTKIKNSESNKIFGTHLSPLFKEKKLPPYNNCSNHVYVEFYYASNGKRVIFYFCRSIELYLIKGCIFWLLEIWWSLAYLVIIKIYQKCIWIPFNQ